MKDKNGKISKGFASLFKILTGTLFLSTKTVI